MGFFDEQSGGLVTHWKSVSAITSLVGSGSNARIYPEQARQGAALPYVLYTRAFGGTVHRHLGGYNGSRQSIVHVYCYASTRSGADALAESVKIGSQNMRGTYTGITVLACFIDEPPDDGHDSPLDGSDTKRYWTRLVLRIVHTESTS